MTVLPVNETYHEDDVFLILLILSTYRTVPEPRQTAISTCRDNGTNVSEYRYIVVEISVRRHIGTSTYRYVDIAVHPYAGVRELRRGRTPK